MGLVMLRVGSAVLGSVQGGGDDQVADAKVAQKLWR